MKKQNENLEVHLNLKITNKLFMEIDTLRTNFLKENQRMPSRSEMVRILLEDALTLRAEAC